MSLAPLLLDDFDWRKMVDIIRSRIAAVSGEEWTLHAPVDPGVALLELFAHQIDLRGYWLDQVPDALINGLVALLRDERLPASAAATVLEIVRAGSIDLKRDTVFANAQGNPSLRLAIADDLARLAVDRIDIVGTGGTRSISAAQLPRWAMEPVTLLSADGKASEATITLWLTQPLPAAGTVIGLLLELDAPAGIADGWSNDATPDAPPPAVLQWDYSVASANGFAPSPAGGIDDGTKGLRRSGIVRLTIASDWAAAGPVIDGSTPYRIRLRTDRATFSAPPQLRRIAPNAVRAIHSIPVTMDGNAIEAQVGAWLPLPGRTIALPDCSPPIENSLSLQMRSRDEQWRDWIPAWDFARHGPEDAVVQVDRCFNCLRFGDGLNGRLPVLSPTAGNRVALSYRAGGGIGGNVGSDLAWESDLASADAINVVAGSGGRESESAADARDRVGASLLTCSRAVTIADYEALACATPGVGVARARAIAGHHPQFPCVSVPGAVGVFIVPNVPRGEGWLDSDRRTTMPDADPGMLSAVRARLDAGRLITAEIFVLRPRYRPVAIEVLLVGTPEDPLTAAAALRDGLTLYLDPLVGGVERSGWPFGQPVRPSEIAHELQRLAGEQARVEGVTLRFADEDGDGSACDDLIIGAGELVALHTLRSIWSQPSNERGGLS